MQDDEEETGRKVGDGVMAGPGNVERTLGGQADVAETETGKEAPLSSQTSDIQADPSTTTREPATSSSSKPFMDAEALQETKDFYGISTPSSPRSSSQLAGLGVDRDSLLASNKGMSGRLFGMHLPYSPNRDAPPTVAGRPKSGHSPAILPHPSFFRPISTYSGPSQQGRKPPPGSVVGNPTLAGPTPKPSQQDVRSLSVNAEPSSGPPTFHQTASAESSSSPGTPYTSRLNSEEVPRSDPSRMPPKASREPLLSFAEKTGQAVELEHMREEGRKSIGTAPAPRTSIQGRQSPVPRPSNAESRRRRTSWRIDVDEPTPDKSSTKRGPAPGEEYVTADNGKKLRNYMIHQGANRFWFGGRLVTSGDSPIPFFLSSALAFLLPALFFVFSSSFLWHHVSPAVPIVFAYPLTLIMWSSMLVTALRDPGIVPRGIDVDAEEDHQHREEPEGPETGTKVPTIWAKFRDGEVAIKYCDTCQTFRPPRTSHCRLCNCCIERTDHHCTFLNNCIGRRNYTSFLAFLITAVLSALYVIAFSVVHLVLRHQETGEVFEDWEDIGTLVVAILALAVALPMSGLLGYHIMLTWSNRTTIEMVRARSKLTGASANNFKLRNPLSNVLVVLCRPMTVPSWLAARSYAVRDARQNPEDEPTSPKFSAVHYVA